jgi:hypothetical protein
MLGFALLILLPLISFSFDRGPQGLYETRRKQFREDVDDKRPYAHPRIRVIDTTTGWLISSAMLLVVEHTAYHVGSSPPRAARSTFEVREDQRCM